MNVPFFTLYSYCQDQYIMGASGPVALNGVFINQAMDDYNIDKDERILFSTKVRKIASVVFSAWAEEAEEKMKQRSK